MSLALVVDERRRPSAGRLYDPTAVVQQVARYGSGALPSLDFALTNGTGTGKANAWYLAQRVLAATTFDLLDLYGGLTNFQGATLNFKYVRRVLVAIAVPDGTKKLRVGPQNQTHAWQGPWGGTGATVYEEVVFARDLLNPFGGWAVTDAASDIIPVYNPGATSVTYAIWIIGEV